ncbi:MAG: GC-type dockerin domain-anchored protein [Phycisphaerales bacterium]
MTTTAVGQVAFTDSQGREWRQVTSTAGLSWNTVASVCPQDGQTECAGAVAGNDLTGWIWATDGQVRDMLAEFVPELEEVDQVGGPEYTLAGLGFFGLFEPTQEFYTTVGGFFSLSAISCTTSNAGAITPSVGASYNPNNGSFSVAGVTSLDGVSGLRGVWLFRPTTPPCPADLTGDRSVDSDDLAIVLGSFGTSSADGDVNADGTVDSDDLAILLAAFGQPCP